MHTHIGERKKARRGVKREREKRERKRQKEIERQTDRERGQIDLTVVTIDKMHIQGKIAEHTMLRVGAQGEREMDGREWAVGTGEGVKKKGKKMCDKDDILRL